jgi:hypothetical protein
MSKLLWISHDSQGLTLGFKTLEDASFFLRQQSNNPTWLALWTFRICERYGEILAEAHTDSHMSLSFRQ